MHQSILFRIIICLLIVSTLLCACEKKVDHTANRSLCSDYVSEFILYALLDYDAEKVSVLIHPSSSLTVESIMLDIENYRTLNGVDFSAKENYSFGGAGYEDHKPMNGYLYREKTTYRLPDSIDRVFINLVFLFNDEGIGIYSFEIEE